MIFYLEARKKEEGAEKFTLKVFENFRVAHNTLLYYKTIQNKYDFFLSAGDK